MVLNDILIDKKMNDDLEDCIIKTYKSHKLYIISSEEDFRQEVYLDLMKNVPKYDESRVALKTFLTMVIMKRAKKVIRTAKGSSKEYNKLEIRNNTISLDTPFSESEGEKEPFSAFLKDEKFNVEGDFVNSYMISEILNADYLTEKQKNIINLFLQEYTITEIGEILKCTQGNVSIHFKKAKEKILMNYA